MKKVVLKKILEDIGVTSSSGTEVIALDQFMKRAGLMVSLTMKGGENVIGLPSSFVRREITDESLNTFLNAHLKTGGLQFLPEPLVKEFVSVKQRARRALYEHSVSVGRGFIPRDSYKDFLEVFEDCREEFNALKRETLNAYDDLKDDFISSAEKLMLNLYKDKDLAKIILKDLVRKIPSKERFEQSFEFSQQVMLIPSFDESVFSEDDEDLMKSVESSGVENSLAIITDALGKMTGILFKELAKASKFNEISEAREASILNGIDKVRKTNFIGYPFIEETCQLIGELVKQKTFFEEIEYFLAKVYFFAKENELVEYLSYPKGIDEEYLESLKVLL